MNEFAIEELTPRQIVAALDEYIVGQTAAKKAVAVALRNRFRRQQLSPDVRQDVMPKNILMIGPTGVGKTEIARRLARLAQAPFVKVEATKFTEVGYVGRDVESMVRELVAASVRLVEAEKTAEVREEAKRRAEERLIDIIDNLLPADEEPEEEVVAPDQEPEYDFSAGYFFKPETPEQRARREARRASIKSRLEEGEWESLLIEVDAEEASSPFMQVFTPQGMEEVGIDGANLPGQFGSRRVIRKLPVEFAREFLQEEEAKKMIDQAAVRQEAVRRAEESGIIFLDEIDKIAAKQDSQGPDVSREGVQRDLLPIIEGSTVQTKFGPVRTDHVLFICAGAFHISKPTDLIPELQGRLPIRVQLEALSEADFRRILLEPKNSLVRQYQLLLQTEGVEVTFDPEALDEVARLTTYVNEKTQNIGARRLHTMMEKLLEELLFLAPDPSLGNQRFDLAKVRDILTDLVADAEKSGMML